ncbi:MAG: hypothetical protein ONB48_05130 [candidate division KSB1 bacterium]|nr:hypothetical protein [candidate division KSB1 bacterium]MDZ7285034.1 hypothetical protein [candidate division KSB1 bacterium]MDZ7298066.1 hypothetical protein [candidate division KSB1 bacterium]MDZ7349301.1 hypothetical protein [candidate division KSB1 bacterium]MDZ7352732.1 hypothetical protein [candidate division KSB1 bacterium]
MNQIFRNANMAVTPSFLHAAAPGAGFFMACRHGGSTPLSSNPFRQAPSWLCRDFEKSPVVTSLEGHRQRPGCGKKFLHTFAARTACLAMPQLHVRTSRRHHHLVCRQGSLRHGIFVNILQ